jgi:hypothetical protein
MKQKRILAAFCSVFSLCDSTSYAETFYSWQADHFTFSQKADPFVGSFDADPDGDGIRNLLEYAFASDPWRFDAGVLPKLGVNQDHLTLAYRKRRTATDLLVHLQASTDLVGGWATLPNVASTIDSSPATYDLQTLTDPTSISGSSRRFLRLNVGLDYYQGQPPVLSMAAGNNQTGGLDLLLPQPLIIYVKNASGEPLAYAPVTFSIDAGLLSMDGDIHHAAPSVEVATDACGRAYIQVISPVYETVFTVTAQAGNGVSGSLGTNLAFSAAASANYGSSGGRAATPGQMPTSIALPRLSYRSSSAGQLNPAILQFGNLKPIQYYLKMTIDSNYDESSGTGDSLATSNGIYHRVKTAHPFQGPSTYTGSSEKHRTGPGQPTYAYDATATLSGDGFGLVGNCHGNKLFKYANFRYFQSSFRG